MDDWRRGRNWGSVCGRGEKVTFTFGTVSNREDLLLLSTYRRNMCLRLLNASAQEGFTMIRRTKQSKRSTPGFEPGTLDCRSNVLPNYYYINCSFRAMETERSLEVPNL